MELEIAAEKDEVLWRRSKNMETKPATDICWENGQYNSLHVQVSKSTLLVIKCIQNFT